MLQVVGEASPEHFHLHFLQAPYMELPQPQLALDPSVTKLHDSSPATILFAGFFASHLLAKRNHCWAFLELRKRTAVLFVVWTTRWSSSAALAILKPGFVELVNHPWPSLASSRRMQDFSLRANTVVLLRLIEKCARRKPVRQVDAARRIFLSHGPQKIDFSSGHLLDILSRGVTAIGHHLLRLFLNSLFHAVHCGQ